MKGLFSKFTIVFLLISAVFFFGSFTKPHHPSKQQESVTVDMSNILGHTIVTFTDDKNDVTVFDSNDGAVQTKILRKNGLYTITFEVVADSYSSCACYLNDDGYGAIASVYGLGGVETVNNVELHSYYDTYINCR